MVVAVVVVVTVFVSGNNRVVVVVLVVVVVILVIICLLLRMNNELREILPSIKLPVLIMHGEDDQTHLVKGIFYDDKNNVVSHSICVLRMYVCI